MKHTRWLILAILFVSLTGCTKKESWSDWVVYKTITIKPNTLVRINPGGGTMETFHYDSIERNGIVRAGELYPIGSVFITNHAVVHGIPFIVGFHFIRIEDNTAIFEIVGRQLITEE